MPTFTTCPTAAPALQPAALPVAPIPPTPYSLTVKQHSPQYSPFLASSTDASLPLPVADAAACSSGPRAGSGVLHASSQPLLDDRSGALRWLHGWAALASGDIEPSMGPHRAPPSAPRWAAPNSPDQRSVSSLGDGSGTHSMLSGHQSGSPHSLAPTVDSLRTPAPLGGHLARSSPPVEPPLVQLPLSRKRQATRGAVVDLAPHFQAAAVAAGQQKRARVAPAAPALALAGEPAWASSLTRALREATTATR